MILFEKVLMNLLSNAFKFTPDKGTFGKFLPSGNMDIPSDHAHLPNNAPSGKIRTVGVINIFRQNRLAKFLQCNR